MENQLISAIIFCESLAYPKEISFDLKFFSRNLNVFAKEKVK